MNIVLTLITVFIWLYGCFVFIDWDVLWILHSNSGERGFFLLLFMLFCGAALPIKKK